MVAISAIATFDMVAGSIAVVGLLYLIYSDTTVVHYARFFRLITLGLLVYAVTGPVIGRLEPALIHGVHGLAALFIALGLYDLVHDDLVRDQDFRAVLAPDAIGPEAGEPHSGGPDVDHAEGTGFDAGDEPGGDSGD